MARFRYIEFRNSEVGTLSLSEEFLDQKKPPRLDAQWPITKSPRGSALKANSCYRAPLFFGVSHGAYVGAPPVSRDLCELTPKWRGGRGHGRPPPGEVYVVPPAWRPLKHRGRPDQAAFFVRTPLGGPPSLGGGRRGVLRWGGAGPPSTSSPDPASQWSIAGRAVWRACVNALDSWCVKFHSSMHGFNTPTN